MVMPGSWREAVEACTDHGVTERPPVPGRSYVAFVVHPPEPRPIFALAIAHDDGAKYVIDLVRQDIAIEASADLIKSYGIGMVTGALAEGDDLHLAHAVAGAVDLLKQRRGMQ
jgi:hypothetical protein